MNYSIKLNLRALKGAFLNKIKGQKETKMCLIIPIEESGLFVGEKGVYLNMTAFERDPDKITFGNTHSVRVSVDQSIYENMTPEEKRAIPFLGDMIPIKRKTVDDAENKSAIDVIPDDNDDLPF